jgi:cytochrome c553
MSDKSSIEWTDATCRPVRATADAREHRRTRAAKGYAAEHHLTVEPVCSTCHHRRSEIRGEAFYVKDIH